VQKLISFTQVSLDGYFADSHGDMSWAHKRPDDAEWNAFVAGNASGGGTLLFGRVTYEMMASFWPTPMAAQMMPDVAEQMNKLPKVVFSRTLSTVTWSNTRLFPSNLVEEVRQLKQDAGAGIAILGSGSLVSQLASAGLIDEFQVVVNPIALGQGKSLFAGIARPLQLKLKSERTFSNGNVVLTYVPVA
jgi:dihydrofolate reductase